MILVPIVTHNVSIAEMPPAGTFLLLDNQRQTRIIRNEEQRLTAAPQANVEGLRSKDRKTIATWPSGGRFFRWIVAG